MTNAWMSWSSGKDSAYALHVARNRLRLNVSGLLCTMNADADRVAMHAVRRDLVLAQAEAVGLPVRFVELEQNASFEEYERQMAGATSEARRHGAEAIVFGDLYLRDVREYRERALASTGIQPIFPLWGAATDMLATEMLSRGVRAIVTCVDPRQIPSEFVGRAYDRDFLAQLPAGADLCGENGEFHTFVLGGPGFDQEIDVLVGDIVERAGFAFCDLRQRDGSSA